MTEDVERMFTEVLAQRLGLDGGEAAQPHDGNQLKTALALSLMQQFRSRPHAGGGASVTIRRVAAILGACPRCLGDDLACSHCEGHGQPGTRTPDRTALLEWLEPPLQRLGLRITARKTSTRRSQPIGG